ncbi:hypothetical protein BH11PSE12_BH11PSE12_09170 [soil metagenome]
MATLINGAIEFIMRPCSRIMGKLSLSTKLLCMFGTFIMVMLTMSATILIKEQNEAQIADAEFQGVLLSKQIMQVLLQTQKHRGQVNMKLSGQDTEAALSSTRAALTTKLDLLDAAIAAHPEFALAASWKPSAEELRQLAAGKVAASASDSLAQHSRLITQILRVSALNNEASGLLFDPEAASYLLMDISIQKMPIWIEQLAILRGMGAGLVKAATVSPAQQAQLLSHVDALQTAITSVTDLDDAVQRAKQAIPAEQQEALEASRHFIQTVRQNLLGESVSGEALAYFNEGTQAIEKAVRLQSGQQDQLANLLKARISTLETRRSLIIVIMLAAIAATSYLVFGFYRSFILAMGEVGQSAISVAAGDLTKQIHVNGKDELAQTGAALEQMNFSLSALVANVRTNASMVAQLGQQLAIGINDMAIRTEQQASSLEQTSASVEDLAGTVKKNADSAKEVSSLASNVRLIAEASSSTMREAVTTMQGIQTSALKMEEIVSMIDRIAFQTDILALNAAVEASHAGEQGRGFAVVASEVRGLAQRSADAARQIRRLIDDAVSRVETGVEQINDVNLTLTDIVSGIQHLATNITSISTASVDQSNGLTQISEAIHHLDEITQSNGKMAEESKHSSIDLEQRALMLTQSVATFKLRQGTADEAYALVKKAVSLYRVNGISSLERITADKDKTFADRDMYVFAFNRRGQYLAFAGNAAKLAVNLMDVSGLNGRKLVEDAFAVPPVGGWVDYQIVNPLSKKIETKTSYIEAVSDNMVLGCGVYKSV